MAAGDERAPRGGDDFSGSHVLVTGGGTGIGAAISAAFGAAGAGVTLVGRRPEPLQRQAASLASAGVRVAYLPCDVTDPAAVEATFRQAAEDLGPVDILVNNAGSVESAPLAKVSPEMLARTLANNLVQLFFCTQAALPGMTARGFGRIVNIASTASLTGYPYVTAYCAAKHGALGFTRALAMEVVRTGVTVNAVCPGYTDTPLLDGAVETVRSKTGRSPDDVRAQLARVNPMGRLITPEEVARTVLWLASPGAAAITGQAIVVAGGELMP